MADQFVSKRAKLGGAIYVLPNLLTTGNLFFGFFSMINSMQGNFVWGAGAIMLAAVFDILDGRVARLTHSSSEFGVQYDSLCDLVSFGCAPAFLMHHFALHDFGRLGWAVCFIFLACGALRLARFNVQSSIGQASGDFTGLPIPMAAGVVASFVSMQMDLATDIMLSPPWLVAVQEFVVSQEFRRFFLLIAAPFLALMMVSTIRYRSHKTVNPKALRPFKILVGAVVLVGLSVYRPEMVGFLVFFLFSLSGIVEWLMGWKKAMDEDEIFSPLDEES